MHLIPTLRRRFGRKAKKWLENLSSRSYVVRKKNQKSGSRKGRNTMTKQAKLGGSFTLPGTPIKLVRMGYGAMQLAGPEIWGPPRDVNTAIAVLQEAVESGVNHIDTSDYYGPHVTNQIIKKALHPYAKDLVIVNLRVGGISEPGNESIEEPLTVLVKLKREGLIRHIGLSNISPKQLVEAQAMTEIVCVQNFYNVAQRNNDAFIDDLAAQGIAYVPFFPLGGFTPLQSSALDAAAASLKATPMQVALAWLLQRSPNILLIPGTSSLAHLRENLEASRLQIPSEVIADLDAIGTRPTGSTSGRSTAAHRGKVASR